MNRIKFTLVHGTFSANADWVNSSAADDPSQFRANLQNRFHEPVDFSVPPAWGSTGVLKAKDLTNSARLVGADKLRTHLLNEPESDGHFVVAHSHGGNVAMYALQDPDVAQKVDGLICMGTPFLYPRRRPLSVVALSLSLAIMLLGYGQFVWSANLMQSGLMPWLSALGLFLLSVVIPAGLTWLVIHERRRFKSSPESELQTLLNTLSYRPPDIPILLVRGGGDEASGLLRGAQFVNWLGGVGMRIGGGQLYLWVCAAVLTLSWMAYRGSDVVPDFVVPLLNQGLMFSAGVMVILLMSLTLSRIFVGLDAWRWVGEIETLVEDGPPGVNAELRVIRPRDGDKGLSHTSIYAKPEAIDCIAEWCQRVLANTSASTGHQKPSSSS